MSKENIKPHEPRIMIVDDEAPARKLLSRIIVSGGYPAPFEASDAAAAQAQLREAPYDLVVTDMQMPGTPGLELVRHVALEYPEIATIMVTGLDDRQLAEDALMIGAYGYVIKPIRSSELLINVSNALKRLALEIENRAHRERLEQLVKFRTTDLWDAINKLEGAEKELRLSRAETIHRLALAAEYRDKETRHHISRMSLYCELLARASGQEPEMIEMIRDASQMHDIGKIGIPDHILLKPGPLTPEERETMQTHAAIGYQILKGSKSALLKMAATIAHTHHERLDGTGYPQALSSKEIPVEGKIAAVADVFDALTTNRVYRRAFPIGVAVQMMKEESGTHFDPDLLDCFLGILDQVLQVKDKYDDGGLAPKAPRVGAR